MYTECYQRLWKYDGNDHFFFVIVKYYHLFFSRLHMRDNSKVELTNFVENYENGKVFGIK